MQEHLARRFPREGEVSEGAHQRALRAKALDAVRGLLPAATQANVGIFGTGQAYEALLLRMRAQPQAEVRQYADWMLEELRRVIPAFLRRVDQPGRGLDWTSYLATTRASMSRAAVELLEGIDPEPQPEVVLAEHDPEGEVKVVAAALYPVSRLGDRQLLELARRMSPADRLRVLRDYVGARGNRRHRPGRAFERTSYRFDVLADYGAFRDLQRHRLLTIEWQKLGPHHGYEVPPLVAEAGGTADWTRVMQESAELHGALAASGLPQVADYAVSMAYRVRFYMDMNAREAMHVIELRTSPQGHPAYRRICQTMRRLIAEVAGHGAIAESMRFAGEEDVALERLDAEQAAERRKQAGP
jgi:thymidylate synthase ThyX